MDCQSAKNVLADLVAGTLSSRSEAHVRAHLAQCPSCRASFASEEELLHTLDSALRAELNPAVPLGLASRIRARVASGAPPRSHWVPAWALAVAVAAVVVAWILVSSKWLGTQPEETHSVSTPRNPLPVQDDPTAGAEPLAPRVARAKTAQNRNRRATQNFSVGQPAVLLPVAQREAMLRFVDGLRRGEISGERLLADRRALEFPLPDIAPLEWDALIVKPLEDVAPDVQ